MFLVFSFLVNRDYCGLFPQSWNGAWLPGFVEKSQNGFLGWMHMWRIMSFVTPSGSGAFLFLTFWFPLLVHPSGWHQSCIRQQVCFFLNFISDMPCSFSGEFHCALLLVHVGETVCGSLLCKVLVLWLNDCLPLLWIIFVKQLDEYPEFCSVLFQTEGCSLLCHAVLVWWSLCRVNSALALLWFSTFVSVRSCSCVIMAWLTASCNSCSCCSTRSVLFAW